MKAALTHIARRLLRLVARTALFLLLTLFAFVVVEGVASLVLLAQRVHRHWQHPLAERLHTHYDRELGWVSTPNRRIVDLYGPGRTLTTNSRGFRGAPEVSDTPRPGIERIVCSGDSFTLGFGVGDDDTWCHLLETLAPRRETVNMGQGGYGIDQAWLWYRRDARTLEHRAHIFAFIREDLDRMLTDSFGGYGKPRLRLKDGALVVRNVPVPHRGYLVPWLTDNLQFVQWLRSVTLAQELFGHFIQPDDQAPRDPRAALPLALAVFEDLARLNREKGSLLILVLLPDHSGPGPVDTVRAALASETAKRGIVFVDLVEEMRKLPDREIDRLFISGNNGPVPYLAGHYTVEGNRFVARALDARLRALLQD